jgi:KipI family sensor histidine kinase inhibitor
MEPQNQPSNSSNPYTHFNMTINIVCVDTLLLSFGEEISEHILDEVQATFISLQSLEGIFDLTPSYCSILVQYDMFAYTSQSMKSHIYNHLSSNKRAKPNTKENIIHIPVNYEQNLDLERVAKHNNLSIEEVINLHCQETYRVYAIGFMLGFAYLAKVDKAIQTPRLQSPRKKVPKGSVALADSQTAIYPKDSAGGWNIIGHTDFDDFECFSVGDRVRFESNANELRNF